ncbi:MAG: DUF6883 domain-containing protein [Hyphomonadaceae bacterium]
MTQPFGDKVSLSEAKLTEYTLSPIHRIGASKARVFMFASGLGQETYSWHQVSFCAITMANTDWRLRRKVCFGLCCE